MFRIRQVSFFYYCSTLGSGAPWGVVAVPFGDRLQIYVEIGRRVSGVRGLVEHKINKANIDKICYFLEHSNFSIAQLFGDYQRSSFYLKPYREKWGGENPTDWKSREIVDSKPGIIGFKTNRAQKSLSSIQVFGVYLKIKADLFEGVLNGIPNKTPIWLKFQKLNCCKR